MHLKKTKGGEMGKRIEREKMTIQRMIALYQRRCPEAQADNAHYQALNAYADKRLDKCVWRANRPASSVRCIATSRRSARR